MGRPKADIDEYFRRILPLLQRGCSVSEACLEADVPRTTVQDYITSDKKFSAKIEAAKNTINILAQKNISEAIEQGDFRSSEWWLERKKKKEYSTRTEQDVNLNTDEQFSDLMKKLHDVDTENKGNDKGPVSQ